MEENQEPKTSNELSVTESNYNILGFNELNSRSDTITDVFTNIKDEKVMFNLENKVDVLLNDCENEIIEIKDVLIKRYIKPMKNPVIDEQSGEIIKDTEMNVSCVLVDTQNKSYATGSKTFTFQLIRYLQMTSRINKQELKPFKIKIIKKKMANSNNKALSFELV